MGGIDRFEPGKDFGTGGGAVGGFRGGFEDTAETSGLLLLLAIAFILLRLSNRSKIKIYLPNANSR